MRKKLWVYYNPNEKDPNHKYGDCTIRALAKALNCTWLEAFDLTIPLCREAQCTNIFDTPLKIRTVLMEKLGFKYTGISNKKGCKRPTVYSFSQDHPKGTYICNVASHEVTVVNGQYHDTWDSGDCSMYGYFEKI